MSAAISYGRGIRIKPPEPLAEFATARIIGIPLMTFAVLAISVALAVVLEDEGFLAMGLAQRADAEV